MSDYGYFEFFYFTVMVNLFVNDIVSNESYIESFLRKELEINIEEKEL